MYVKLENDNLKNIRLSDGISSFTPSFPSDFLCTYSLINTAEARAVSLYDTFTNAFKSVLTAVPDKISYPVIGSVSRHWHCVTPIMSEPMRHPFRSSFFPSNIQL
jgi:hypothetical protein